MAGLGVWLAIAHDEQSPLADALARAVSDAPPAVEPFPGLSEAAMRVGSERLRIVVADDVNERSLGLRKRSTLAPYDGMLFAYPEPVVSAFTMSTVPVSLDIAFYDGAGRMVDRLRMRPCAGSEGECPLYRPDEEFQYALETLAGELPKGRLRAAD